MIEIVEMLRLWLQGWGLREVARLSGADRKTVRRYVDRARACGLDRDGGDGQLTDELIAAVIAGVRASRPTGKSLPWETIAAEHQQIQQWLTDGLTIDQDPHAVGASGRGGVVSDVAPLCHNGIRFREATDHGAGGRLRTGRGGAGRLRATGDAHRHQRWPAPGGARVDLHRGLLAAHVRLAHLPPDAPGCDRRVRSGVAVFRQVRRSAARKANRTRSLDIRRL